MRMRTAQGYKKTDINGGMDSSAGWSLLDLTNVDFKLVVQDIGKTAEDASSYTNFEFNQIVENPKLLKATNFYENGIKKSAESVVKEFQDAIKQAITKPTN
jgi:hypothetical protein